MAVLDDNLYFEVVTVYLQISIVSIVVFKKNHKNRLLDARTDTRTIPKLGSFNDVDVEVVDEVQQLRSIVPYKEITWRIERFAMRCTCASEFRTLKHFHTWCQQHCMAF